MPPRISWRTPRGSTATGSGGTLPPLLDLARPSSGPRRTCLRLCTRPVGQAARVFRERRPRRPGAGPERADLAVLRGHEAGVASIVQPRWLLVAAGHPTGWPESGGLPTAGRLPCSPDPEARATALRPRRRAARRLRQRRGWPPLGPRRWPFSPPSATAPTPTSSGWPPLVTLNQGKWQVQDATAGEILRELGKSGDEFVCAPSARRSAGRHRQRNVPQSDPGLGSGGAGALLSSSRATRAP